MIRILRVVLMLACAGSLRAQPLDNLRPWEWAKRREGQGLVIRVAGGSGIIVARTKRATLVITAGHEVATKPGDHFESSLGSLTLIASACDQSNPEQCLNLTPQGKPCIPPQDPSTTSETDVCGKIDLAILVGATAHIANDFALAEPAKLNIGDKLGISGFLNADGTRFPLATEPIGDVVFASPTSPTFDYTARFGILPTGISGGAVFDARGRLRGIQSTAASASVGVQRATLWNVAQSWVVAELKKDHAPLLNRADANDFIVKMVHNRSESVLAIDKHETELAFSLQSIIIVPGRNPQTDPSVTKLSPGFRVARLLPIYHGVLLTGDLTFSGTSQPLELNQSINREFLMVSIGGQWQLGERFGALRRSNAFGGVYLGGGLGWLSVTRRLAETGGDPSSINSWTPYVEGGWRFRVPKRPWGIQANYREVLSGPVSGIPGRVHIFSGGAFIALR